jgi:hypothetical protein
MALWDLPTDEKDAQKAEKKAAARPEPTEKSTPEDETDESSVGVSSVSSSGVDFSVGSGRAAAFFSAFCASFSSPLKSADMNCWL